MRPVAMLVEGMLQVRLKPAPCLWSHFAPWHFLWHLCAKQPIGVISQTRNNQKMLCTVQNREAQATDWCHVSDSQQPEKVRTLQNREAQATDWCHFSDSQQPENAAHNAEQRSTSNRLVPLLGLATTRTCCPHCRLEKHKQPIGDRNYCAHCRIEKHKQPIGAISQSRNNQNMLCAQEPIGAICQIRNNHKLLRELQNRGAQATGWCHFPDSHQPENVAHSAE